MQKKTCFELRSGVLDTLFFIIKTGDLDLIHTELKHRFQSTPDFFAQEGIIIDVRALQQHMQIALPKLIELLQLFDMCPMGVIASAQQSWVKKKHPDFPVFCQEVTQKTEESTPFNAPSQQTHSTLIEKPLRSGQQIYIEGDVILLASVSFGAEIIATGNIHIYAPLRGRALAGVHGNTNARIFCSCLAPELISIAGIYCTAETLSLDALSEKSVQVRLENERIVIEPL